MKTTLSARILAATRLLPVAALWAFLGRIRLVDTVGRDSSELGFVLDHPSKLAIGPLVETLVHLFAVVDPITNAANVADCDRRDTSLKEHLHDLPRQFVKEVRDLVVYALELITLRLDHLLPTIRPALFAVYFRIELGLEAVLVVAQGTKLAAVYGERVVARKDSSEMLLAKVDSGSFISAGSVNGLSVVLSSYDKPISRFPNLDGSGFFTSRPVNQN